MVLTTRQIETLHAARTQFNGFAVQPGNNLHGNEIVELFVKWMESIGICAYIFLVLFALHGIAGQIGEQFMQSNNQFIRFGCVPFESWGTNRSKI